MRATFARLSFLLLLVAAGLCAAPKPGPEAVYLGGTLKTIPQGTVGSLDLTDPKQLRFSYGDSSYDLPYSRVKSYQVEHAQGGHRTLAHLPLPKLQLGPQPQILDISYRDDQGGIATLSFKLMGRNSSSTEWMLSERIRKDKEQSADGRTKLPETWWGDRYWKTTRNKSTWPEPQVETNNSLAGTK